MNCVTENIRKTRMITFMENYGNAHVRGQVALQFKKKKTPVDFPTLHINKTEIQPRTTPQCTYPLKDRRCGKPILMIRVQVSVE